MQRFHQRRAEGVASGEIVGASTLLLVAAGAVEVAAGGDVQRDEGLQQEFQRGLRQAGPGFAALGGTCLLALFLRVLDHPEVVLGEIEQADAFDQGASAQLVPLGEAGLGGRIQVPP
ncbi:hypothetical protein IFM12275_05560 [Nocardia sputorum]|nr:hypothetical protein IFM12275_05560 [Nocardia sputorum]